MVRPSMIASSLSGLLILIASLFYLTKINEFSQDSFKNIIVLLLIAIGLGIHSISHYYEEIYFDFNPFAGKWKIRDSPKKIENSINF